jgi:hypothetical protein
MMEDKTIFGYQSVFVYDLFYVSVCAPMPELPILRLSVLLMVTQYAMINFITSTRVSFLIHWH